MVDEAVSVAKAVCAATPNAVCLALTPILQASTEQTVVVRRRRKLEDLMSAPLDALKVRSSSDKVFRC